MEYHFDNDLNFLNVLEDLSIMKIQYNINRLKQLKKEIQYKHLLAL